MSLRNQLQKEGPILRKKTVEFDEGFSVTIHEMDMGHHRALLDELFDKDVEKTDDWYIYHAIRYTEGQDYQPTDEDIALFKANLSEATISSIFQAGFNFNRDIISMEDAAKKSSPGQS